MAARVRKRRERKYLHLFFRSFYRSVVRTHASGGHKSTFVICKQISLNSLALLLDSVPSVLILYIVPVGNRLVRIVCFKRKRKRIKQQQQHQ